MKLSLFKRKEKSTPTEIILARGPYQKKSKQVQSSPESPPPVILPAVFKDTPVYCPLMKTTWMRGWIVITGPRGIMHQPNKPSVFVVMFDMADVVWVMVQENAKQGCAIPPVVPPPLLRV